MRFAERGLAAELGDDSIQSAGPATNKHARDGDGDDDDEDDDDGGIDNGHDTWCDDELGDVTSSLKQLAKSQRRRVAKTLNTSASVDNLASSRSHGDEVRVRGSLLTRIACIEPSLLSDEGAREWACVCVCVQ